MPWIDFRSDTVTWPTVKMRQAMAAADVGDDVYGEDSTVIRLEELSAERLGKEAGLFIPSGTMGNLVAVLTHCGRGDEVILGDISHTFVYEAGGISALGGIFPHTLPNQPDGSLRLDDIKDAIRMDNVHFPKTRLVILENTHNRCGGAVLDAAYTSKVAEIAHQAGFSLHLDGARIFNAAVALGVDVKTLTQPADSITFCLSKALCAPVGSVLCGSAEFIHQARRIRKQVGGGMRQAGILAAAGIIAIQEMVDQLAADHLRARRLAEGLSDIPGLLLDDGPPLTNMVYVNLGGDVKRNAAEVAEAIQKQGIRVGVINPRRFRLVTHYWIDDEAVEKVIKAFQAVLKA
ncbi:MAG: low-specificity L-threonine aldolase [Anaerolineaceae bacterium]|nr:low-specificity L-threonine aldolase [Anaerolineaceae bacterium]